MPEKNATPPPPASGEPTDAPMDADALEDENVQLPLIGNLPDGEAASGATPMAREEPDGLDG